MRLLLLLLASFSIVQAASDVPIHLESSIPMPGVVGRIDHLSFDPETGRLFVAALANNTVEVIDTKGARSIRTISGLHEPQGVLYVADVNRLYVANGDDGTLKIFDGTSYRLLKSVSLGSDADNVRFDPERKEIYVGYGAGSLAILHEDGTKVDEIKLDAHPESFQLEKNGSRIFINLPDSRKIAVVDRKSKAVISTWKTGQALANFPMSLDEQNRRLFIVCRKPAQLLVLNTDTGAIVTTLVTVGDCDDVFYDRITKRLYMSGGDGHVAVLEQQSPDRYSVAMTVTTRKGARTSFLSTESHNLFVAARQQNLEPAAIYVYGLKK